MNDGVDTVLLVDDDRVTNLMHSRVLKRSGLVRHIDVATDGQAALEHLNDPGTRPPELILLDINMPRMGGFEFLEEYDRLPMHLKAGQIIIMLTTSLLDRDRERAEADPNVHRFANKPITADQVPEIIADCLNWRRSA